MESYIKKQIITAINRLIEETEARGIAKGIEQTINTREHARREELKQFIYEQDNEITGIIGDLEQLLGFGILESDIDGND